MNWRAYCAFGALALSLGGGAGASFAAPGSTFSVAKGTSQQDALAELHRASGMLVLSEKTQLEHKALYPVEAVPVSDGILAVTSAYHLHALVGARQVVFVRRFWDPRERLDLPLEEMASIVIELHRLFAFVAHPKTTSAREGLMDRFFASLSPQQLAVARGEGLRFQDLSNEQRAAWEELTNDNAYSRPEEMLAPGRAFFEDPKAASFDWRPILGQPELRNLYLWWPFVNPLRSSKFYSADIYSDRHAPEGESVPGHAVESSEDLPPLPKPVTRCPARCGDFEQPAALESIVDTVGRANNVTVDVPTWARRREYYVFARGHSGDELLQAIAAANGWQIRAVSRNRYRLERPVAQPPSDGWDVYRQVWGLIPPAVRLLVPNIRDENILNALRIRSATELKAMAAQVATLTPGDQEIGGYKEIPLSKLSETWQRRVETFVFMGDINKISHILNQPQPPGWLVRPETGHFRLQGRSFDFVTIRDTGDPSTSSTEAWGWIL